MSNRTHKDRYPPYSIKSWVGSPGSAVKKWYRRLIRARQKAAMRKDPEDTTVQEEHKLKHISWWY